MCRNNSDMETPKGKKGVDEVLEQFFSYGSATLDRVAFQKALDEIGAQESAGADFSLKVLAGHFERGVQLLADNELNPASSGRGLQDSQAAGRGDGRGQARKPGLPHEKGACRGPLPEGRPFLAGGDPGERLVPLPRMT